MRRAYLAVLVTFTLIWLSVLVIFVQVNIPPAVPISSLARRWEPTAVGSVDAQQLRGSPITIDTQLSDNSDSDIEPLDSAISCFGDGPFLSHQSRKWEGPAVCRMQNLYWVNGLLQLQIGSLDFGPIHDGLVITPVVPHYGGKFTGLDFRLTAYVGDEVMRRVEQPTFFVGLWHYGNYGHWIHDNLMALYITMRENGGVFPSDTRIVVTDIHDYSKSLLHVNATAADRQAVVASKQEMFDMLRMFTRFPVLLLQDVPDKTLFVEAVAGLSTNLMMYHRPSDRQAQLTKEWLSLVFKYYKVQHSPVFDRPVVTIIQRTNGKRSILNFADIVKRAAFGDQVIVQVVKFSSMSVASQIAFMRNTTVLVGITGSDCNNAMFLPQTSAFIQLTPFKCEIRGDRAASPGRKVRNQVIAAGVTYVDWTNMHAVNVEVPWHKWVDRCGVPLTSSVANSLFEDQVDGCIMWTFWQNQNTHVESNEFQALLFDTLQHLGHCITWSPSGHVLRWKPTANPDDQLGRLLLASRSNENVCMRVMQSSMLPNSKVLVIRGSCESLRDNPSSPSIPLLMHADGTIRSQIHWLQCLRIVSSDSKLDPHFQFDDCVTAARVRWNFLLYEHALCQSLAGLERWCMAGASDGSVTLKEHPLEVLTDLERRYSGHEQRFNISSISR